MSSVLGRSASITDTGRRRRHNEDAYVCEPPLFAVADGMGGAQAGELASGLAAAALRDDTNRSGGEERVDELIQQANRRVYERQTQDSSASGMGTTITVALVEDSRVAIGHVGDSRAYLIRDRRLEQLTEDHSLVAELVRSGKLSPEEADTHPQRSVITRALGTDPDVDVDTFSVETRPGDLFLLCSDGLTSMIDDDTILREVERNRSDLQAAAKALVRAANKGGGDDNITVVFFEIAGTNGSDGATERTVALPPVEDDEDATLSELDRVPAVAVEEPERQRRDGHPGRNALLVVVGLLLVIAVLGGAVWGLWRSHFVGAEPDGHVAVYQGVPWNLVGNVRLYRAVYVSPLLTAQLSQAERKQLFDHHLSGESAARARVRRYEKQIGAG
ncbi:MAG TPA: Stp1/IreP family PP2C-type Ser/Thr phosphatase [Gaiellaceae bacterium]|nr:Stp1/IreP family PP2C-type Ser/Thr phosphatase [Gaiellaceae bacterium]